MSLLSEGIKISEQKVNLGPKKAVPIRCKNPPLKFLKLTRNILLIK